MLNLLSSEKISKELKLFKDKAEELSEPKKSEAELLIKQLEKELDLMSLKHGGGIGYLDHQTMKDVRDKSVSIRRQIYHLLKLR